MFFHIFKYRIKTIFRSKEEIFWILIFPIALGTCFYAAFSNITKNTEEFSTIDVAVVLENSQTDTYFKSVVDSLSEKTDDTDTPLLSVTYTDMENANKLLSDSEVTGIISLNNGNPELTISGDGINESILKEFLDQYIQTVSVLSDIQLTDAGQFASIINKLTGDMNYIIDKKLTNGNTDVFTDYYYSLIAMVCLFASFSGQSCATDMKANISALGMRKSLASVNRMLIIIGDFLATCLFQCAAIAILVIYLDCVLQVNLGGSFPLVLLTGIAGSIIGVGWGIFIGSIPKLSDNLKMTINVSISLFSSFLSGLMVGGIKYEIEKVAPIVNKLNPATIITDALYSLNIYDTYGRYLQCMTTLGIYCVILCVISYFMTRRESYASL